MPNRPDRVLNRIAGGAISKYRVVKFGADADHVVQAAAATDSLLGVAVELDKVADERVDVVLTGDCTVEYGAAVTEGDLLTSDANGKAVPVSAAAGANERVIGVALVDGVDGDYGSVLLSQGNYQGA